MRLFVFRNWSSSVTMKAKALQRPQQQNSQRSSLNFRNCTFICMFNTEAKETKTKYQKLQFLEWPLEAVCKNESCWWTPMLLIFVSHFILIIKIKSTGSIAVKMWTLIIQITELELWDGSDAQRMTTEGRVCQFNQWVKVKHKHRRNASERFEQRTNH